MEMLLQVLLLAAGFTMLVKGADLFVDGASALAAKFHIPQLVIGLTVVAMGTSMPEAAVSISAALKGNADITIGNIVGSNILNILIILGLSAVIMPLAVGKSTIRYEMPFLAGITVLLFVQGLDGTVSLIDGAVLVILFIAYLLYLLVMAKKDHEKPNANGEDENVQQRKLWQILLFTIAGLGIVVFGSTVAVDAASAIARILGMSERFIGLTIVALGTSLPELCTSVSAAGKGNSDIAIGNIVGSCIFNILFVIGLSALVTPVPFAPAFRFDSIVSGAAALFLLLCCIKDLKLKRWHGVVMLMGYAAYFVYLIEH